MKRWMAPLLITLMLGTSVFAANKNAELEITNGGKKSSEYKKYISLWWDSSNEANNLWVIVILKLIKQKLQIYLNLLEQSKKWLIEWQIDKFKPWAKVLLLDLNKRIIESIWEDETKKIKLIDIYKFVQSVNNFSWRSTLLLDNITK